MVMMKKKKASMGRQKIAIEKISKKNHLQVTFSKRRAGLFKKASELCTLCGAEIAIIVFSPAGKTFSFSHPNVDSIMDRFLSRNRIDFDANKTIETSQNANIHELNMYLSQVQNQLEVEKKRRDELDEMKRASQKQCWWESPIDELGMNELQQLKNAMEELKRNVTEQVNNFLVTNYSLPILTMNDINGVAGNMKIKPNGYGVI